MKAKTNAKTRTLRPDKCLVVSSLSPGLRPDCHRNTVDNAVTTRKRLRRPDTPSQILANSRQSSILLLWTQAYRC